MSTGTRNNVRNDHPMAHQNGNGNGTAMMKPEWDKPTNKQGLEVLTKSVVATLEKSLPSVVKGQGERLVRAMISECQKNPALFECTPLSLFSCVMQAGSMGLTIGGYLGEAYLVPFNNNKTKKKESQLIIGYKGLIQLAHRSGQIRRITPCIVKEGDDFKVYRGMQQNLHHVPLRNNQNRPSDYYVVVELMNGGIDFETMTFEEAIAHRDRFATTRNAPDFVKKSSPWYDMTVGGGFDAMALKTLFRRIAKRLPLSVEMSYAVGLDERADNGQSQPMMSINIPDMPQALVEPEVIEDEEDNPPTENGKLFNDPKASNLPG